MRTPSSSARASGTPALTRASAWASAPSASGATRRIDSRFVRVARSSASRSAFGAEWVLACARTRAPIRRRMGALVRAHALRGERLGAHAPEHPQPRAPLAGREREILGDDVHGRGDVAQDLDRKSTRLNSSHPSISYAVFCLKKKNPVVLR